MRSVITHQSASVLLKEQEKLRTWGLDMDLPKVLVKSGSGPSQAHSRTQSRVLIGLRSGPKDSQTYFSQLTLDTVAGVWT